MGDTRTFEVQRTVYDDEGYCLGCETVMSVIADICNQMIKGKQITKISYSYHIDEYEYELMKAEEEGEEDHAQTPDTG